MENLVLLLSILGEKIKAGKFPFLLKSLSDSFSTRVLLIKINDQMNKKLWQLLPEFNIFVVFIHLSFCLHVCMCGTYVLGACPCIVQKRKLDILGTYLWMCGFLGE